MTFLSEPDYLHDQYQNSANLDARIALHVRFSRNPQGWMPWVFEQIDLAPGCCLLELGCGPAGLWIENRHRISPGWKLFLSDASAGMLSTARRLLQGLSPQPAYAQIDAARLPFAEASLDAVVANHMLYHVPDRSRALGEIRRVLRPGGMLYATTVGENHMREVDELARRFAPSMDDYDSRLIEFNLENGQEQLAVYFQDVRLRRYRDGLSVTEAGPLAAYITSGTRAAITAERRSELESWLAQEIERQSGAIQITKDTGIFIAQR